MNPTPCMPMVLPSVPAAPQPGVDGAVCLDLLPARDRAVIEAYRWACPTEPAAYWLARL